MVIFLKIEVFFRLFVFIVFIADTLFNKEVNSYQYFIPLFLLFVLNSQLRLLFQKDIFVSLSLTIDFIIFSAFNITLSVSPYLLLIISLTDTFMFIRNKYKTLFFMSFVIILYLNGEISSENAFIFVSFSFMLFAFSQRIKKLEGIIEKTNTLYDQNRSYSYQLEDTKKKLETYAKMIEHLSQAEERNRVAREIHDNIGHKLVSILIQLEAAIKILNIDSEKGKEILNSVRDNLRNCTEILGKVVKKIKPKENLYRIQAIDNMIEDFKKNTKININFKITGQYYDLYPSAQLTIYKNIQEAITNSVRHGRATYIDITLSYFFDRVELSIKDNGTGCKEIIKGMGISGMEERVKLLGGKLKITTDNNFKIETIIPVNT